MKYNSGKNIFSLIKSPIWSKESEGSRSNSDSPRVVSKAEEDFEEEQEGNVAATRIQSLFRRYRVRNNIEAITVEAYYESQIAFYQKNLERLDSESSSNVKAETQAFIVASTQNLERFKGIVKGLSTRLTKRGELETNISGSVAGSTSPQELLKLQDINQKLISQLEQAVALEVRYVDLKKVENIDKDELEEQLRKIWKSQSAINSLLEEEKSLSPSASSDHARGEARAETMGSLHTAHTADGMGSGSGVGGARAERMGSSSLSEDPLHKASSRFVGRTTERDGVSEEMFEEEGVSGHLAGRRPNSTVPFISSAPSQVRASRSGVLGMGSSASSNMGGERAAPPAASRHRSGSLGSRVPGMGPAEASNRNRSRTVQLPPAGRLEGLIPPVSESTLAPPVEPRTTPKTKPAVEAGTRILTPKDKPPVPVRSPSPVVAVEEKPVDINDILKRLLEAIRANQDGIVDLLREFKNARGEILGKNAALRNSGDSLLGFAFKNNSHKAVQALFAEMPRNSVGKDEFNILTNVIQKSSLATNRELIDVCIGTNSRLSREQRKQINKIIAEEKSKERGGRDTDVAVPSVSRGELGDAGGSGRADVTGDSRKAGSDSATQKSSSSGGQTAVKIITGLLFAGLSVLGFMFAPGIEFVAELDSFGAAVGAFGGAFVSAVTGIAASMSGSKTKQARASSVQENLSNERSVSHSTEKPSVEWSNKHGKKSSKTHLERVEQESRDDERSR